MLTRFISTSQLKIAQLLLLSHLLVGFQTLIHTASAPITNYQPTFIPVQDQTGDLQIVLRLFNQHHKLYALLVDPYTLGTWRCEFHKLGQRKVHPTGNNPGYFLWKEIAHTPYMQLIKQSTMSADYHSNGGINHALDQAQGVFLTVDMCPSARLFEQTFFEKLVSLSSDKKPFEVGIAISGLWMLGHGQEFTWLCQAVKHNKLHITWINHTLSHLYYPDIPLQDNFMRFSPIAMPTKEEQQLFIQNRLQEEILTTERLLLEHDQLPGVFFRFPGLIADPGLMARLGNLGLIALGADAWLAKGEEPKLGSIILVHGNGNELPGIKKVLKLLADPSWQWLPLSHLVHNKDR